MHASLRAVRMTACRRRQDAEIAAAFQPPACQGLRPWTPMALNSVAHGHPWPPRHSAILASAALFFVRCGSNKSANWCPPCGRTVLKT